MSANRMPSGASPDDPIWAEAWSWVRRQHELSVAGASPEQVAPQALVQWLVADTRHRDAYDKACRLWLAAGLVPSEDDGGSGAAPD